MPSAAAVAAPRANQIALIGLLDLAAAIGIGRFAFTPLFPLMQQHAQLDLAHGAWLAAANYLGYLLGALAYARWPLQPTLAARTGLVGVAAFTVASGLGGGFVVVLVLRLLAGVASAMVLVGVSAWTLPSLAAADRSESAGAVYAGVGAGIALAGVVGLGTALLKQSADLAWIVLGAIAALVAVLSWRTLSARSSAPDQQHLSDAHVRFDARVWRVVLAYGAFGYGYILPATFLPSIARQQFANPALFGAVWPVFGLAAAASTLIAARRRVSPQTLWAVTQLLMAVGVAVPLWSVSLWALLLSAVCVGGTFMVVTMAGMQCARLLGGAGASRLMAAMTAAFGIGQLLGPLSIALLGGGGSTRRDSVPVGASLVATAVLVIGALLVLPLPLKGVGLAPRQS